jgi:succinate-acetate transporter protein
MFMAQLAATPENSKAVVATANPAPLGLSAFALTTFVLSCINAGVIVPGIGMGTNIVVGLALFYGGIVQLLAGMWEFKAGNTFGATAFSSYGGFWLAFGVIFIPGSGILASFTNAAASALHPAIGLFLLGWTIFTFMMFLATLKSNMALIALFALLFLTFLALAVAELGAGSTFTQIGGYLGILTALVAWYTALAGVLSSAKSAFTLPVGPIS